MFDATLFVQPLKPSVVVASVHAVWAEGTICLEESTRCMTRECTSCDQSTLHPSSSRSTCCCHSQITLCVKRSDLLASRYATLCRELALLAALNERYFLGEHGIHAEFEASYRLRFIESTVCVNSIGLSEDQLSILSVVSCEYSLKLKLLYFLILFYATRFVYRREPPGDE